MAEILLPKDGRGNSNGRVYRPHSYDKLEGIGFGPEQYHISASVLEIEYICDAVNNIEVRITLGRPLTSEEQKSLPLEYRYVPSTNTLSRTESVTLFKQKPCLWVIILRDYEDPYISARRDKIHEDSYRVSEGYQKVEIYQAPKASPSLPYPRLEDYELVTERLWKRVFAPCTYTSTYKSNSDYLIRAKLSSYRSDPTFAPFPGHRFGLDASGNAPVKNTPKPLFRALFPAHTSILPPPVCPLSAGTRQIMLDDASPPGVHPYLMDPLSQFTTYDKPHDALLPPLRVGINASCTSFKPSLIPSFIQGKPEWDHFLINDGWVYLGNHMMLWRSVDYWHVLFNVVGGTNGRIIREGEWYPISILLPLIIPNYVVCQNTKMIRGMSPAMNSALMRIPGLSGALKYALNWLQGRMLNIKKSGVDIQALRPIDKRSSSRLAAEEVLCQPAVLNPFGQVLGIDTAPAIVSRVLEYACERHDNGNSYRGIKAASDFDFKGRLTASVSTRSIAL